MSRAFTKEGDGSLDPLPDLPLSPQPNYVTPRGFAALQARLLARQTDLASLRARAERLDKLPEAAAERDIRYLDARLRSAIVIDPTTLPLTEAAFGLRITVADASGAQTSYEITGEDEASAPDHRIAPHSPLARALIGAQVGDSVIWRKPSGPTNLDIVDISHAYPQP
jgi:transcription elongation factor GreB